MELKKEISGNKTKFTVAGEMSVEEAQAFTDALMNSIAKKKPELEIDLSDCEYMCSNGLGALAAALMVARSRGGDLVLTAVSNNVKKLLDITTLSTIINIKKK
ncbi:MAG: STAS domain-containing protein [bacterium]